MSRLGTPRASGLAVFALVAAVSAASGAATKIWVSDSATDFSLGEARGVAVTMDGSLVLARDARRIEGIAEATLFAAARDRDGSILLGTGDAGKLLRVSAAGKVETVAALPEKEVTALAIGPDGALYAGTAPGGKVYRIDPENGEVVGRVAVGHSPTDVATWEGAVWVSTQGESAI